MDDATRINLLGGMLRQAAIAKAARPGALDAQTAAAVGGGPPPGAAALPAPAGGPQQGAPMGQNEFGGQWTPEQRAAQQRALIELLRKRSGAAVTSSESARY